MEDRTTILAVLDLMPQPAFWVENGRITHLNPAAHPYLLSPGTEIAPLITTGAQEYSQFTDGRLHLTIALGGVSFGAVVSNMAGGQLWLPEQNTEQAYLQAMALAAQILRRPLSGMVGSTELLSTALQAQDDPTLQQFISQLNRRIYQMMRIVGNMSDAIAYSQDVTIRDEYTEICGFVEEILEKSEQSCEKLGMRLSWQLPDHAIYIPIDREMVERAIYNLLSNAIKASPVGGAIDVQLSQQGKRLRLSVTDDGSGLPGDAHTRFLREPGLDSEQSGLGLGIVLVRAAAIHHGGAVLIDRTADGRNRVSLTMATESTGHTTLRSPILLPDYAGERDHALLELSDVLPPECYATENI